MGAVGFVDYVVVSLIGALSFGMSWLSVIMLRQPAELKRMVFESASS